MHNPWHGSGHSFINFHRSHMRACVWHSSLGAPFFSHSFALCHILLFLYYLWHSFTTRNLIKCCHIWECHTSYIYPKHICHKRHYVCLYRVQPFWWIYTLHCIICTVFFICDERSPMNSAKNFTVKNVPADISKMYQQRTGIRKMLVVFFGIRFGSATSLQWRHNGRHWMSSSCTGTMTGCQYTSLNTSSWLKMDDASFDIYELKLGEIWCMMPTDLISEIGREQLNWDRV